jgi:glycine betaine/choline ABC-type transport system substrate-binding protein
MLALVMSACSPGGSETSPSASGSGSAPKPAVSVGSQAFPEAAIVGELYAQALEARGYTVERHLEIGERPAVHAAMDAGEINLIPEYLGGLAAELIDSAELATDPQEAWDNVQEPLAGKGWVAFDYSPGTDADGFAVRAETAQELGLATMSDLAEVADQLAWGVAPGCPENAVCQAGLKEIYGIDLDAIDDVQSIEPCSTAMADALNNEVIDVAQVCTTQPDIVTFNFTLLQDDMSLQPAQNVTAVATQELADAAPPDFAETLNAVIATLTTEALTQLQVEVVVDQTSIEDVAHNFLEDNGLL